MAEGTPTHRRGVSYDLLGGLRVVDRSTQLFGASCTKVLTDLGADVVKLEPPAGDPLRRWSASHRDLRGEDGPLSLFLNTSKRSVVDAPEARAGLLAGADVLVETGELDDVELAAVRAAHPHLVVVSLTWFGRMGPWARRPATEFILQAMCGSTGSRGERTGAPMSAGGRIGEWLGGAYGAVAALGAARAGRGEHVDLSVLECMSIAFHGYAGLKRSMGGTGFPVSKRAVEVPSIERTADGYVTLTTNSRQQFDDFLLMIEHSELIGDERYTTKAARQQHRAEFTALSDAWIGTRPTVEVVEMASLLRIPVAPVTAPADTVTTDHFVARGVHVENPRGGFAQPRPPLVVDGVATAPLRPAPHLDEHRDAVHWSPRPTPSEASPGLPLEGVRVIDFTAWWAGPSCGTMLAALGADVIKLESVQRPDGQRFSNTATTPPADRWWETAYLFQAANLNKRGITLDLRSPRGRAALVALATESDLFIENYSPRVLDGFELGWPVLHAANPRLVMLRMPAFGLDGPWRDRTGFAQTMESVSGMAWMTGSATDRPLLPLGPCDPLAGMNATAVALAGLAHRDRTGSGVLCEVPMVESALNAAAEGVIEWSANGVRLARTGNRGPCAAPQGVYPCRGDDEWLALAITDDHQWAALCRIIGREDRSGSSGPLDAAGRRSAHDEIDDAIARWTIDGEPGALEATLVAVGIPAARVVAPVDVASNEQMRARGFVERFDHPLIGSHEVLGVPFRFASRPGGWIRRPAPLLGEHNDEVLTTLAGVTAEELGALRDGHVIGEAPVGS